MTTSASNSLPRCFAALSSSAPSISATTSFAPSRASRSAIASPMPLAAPVTTAMLFFSFWSMQTLPSQNDADAALGAKTFAVQQATLFLDLERAVARHQTIAIAAEISVGYAILGAIGDERRTDFEIVADALPDPDIADEMPGSRMREFGMRGSLHQSLDPLAEPEAVIGDIEKIVVGRRIDGQIRCRHVVNRVVGEKLEPFRQPPFVEQFGLCKEKILDVGASYGLHRYGSVAHAGTWNTCSFQFDQNARICASSS